MEFFSNQGLDHFGEFHGEELVVILRAWECGRRAAAGDRSGPACLVDPPMAAALAAAAVQRSDLHCPDFAYRNLAVAEADRDAQRGCQSDTELDAEPRRRSVARCPRDRP